MRDLAMSWDRYSEVCYAGSLIAGLQSATRMGVVETRTRTRCPSSSYVVERNSKLSWPVLKKV